MSSESFQSDNISSTEDIELTEFVCRPDRYSDSSADITTSCKWSKTEAETSEDQVNDSAISILNSNDENHHALDIRRTSLRSLQGISSGTLTRKASSLDGPSIRKVSSLNPLGPSNRRRSSLKSLEGPSSMRNSSLNPLEKSTSRRGPSLDPLEGPSIRKVSSLNPLEVPSSRRVSSLDPLKRSSSMQVSSLDTLERPTARRVSSLDPLKGPSTRKVSSLHLLKGPSTRRVSSLDPLEGPSTRRVSSLDPLEGPSTRRVSSLDPLEGPSTRTDWFSGSAESSLTSVSQSHHSETEANEHSDSEPPTERNGYCFRALDCLGNWVIQFRQSVYYPCLLGVLILLPYSAGYMGCMYLHLCNGYPELPFLVYLVGLFGTLILFLQLISVLSKRYFSPHLTGQELDTCIGVLSCWFARFLTMEMIATYTYKPVFIPPHEEFCLKILYNYAYYMNMIPPFVILLLMLIILPGYNDPSETEDFSF